MPSVDRNATKALTIQRQLFDWTRLDSRLGTQIPTHPDVAACVRPWRVEAIALSGSSALEVEVSQHAVSGAARYRAFQRRHAAPADGVVRQVQLRERGVALQRLGQRQGALVSDAIVAQVQSPLVWRW